MCAHGGLDPKRWRPLSLFVYLLWVSCPLVVRIVGARLCLVTACLYALFFICFVLFYDSTTVCVVVFWAPVGVTIPSTVMGVLGIVGRPEKCALNVFNALRGFASHNPEFLLTGFFSSSAKTNTPDQGRLTGINP